MVINLLYNLKISLEAIYNELFTSDYLHIEKVDQKIQTRILNSIDLINQSLNRALNVKKFIKIYENYYNEKILMQFYYLQNEVLHYMVQIYNSFRNHLKDLLFDLLSYLDFSLDFYY